MDKIFLKSLKSTCHIYDDTFIKEKKYVKLTFYSDCLKYLNKKCRGQNDKQIKSDLQPVVGIFKLLLNSNLSKIAKNCYLH